MEDGVILSDDVAANVVIENNYMELSPDHECIEENIIITQSEQGTSQNMKVRPNKRGREENEEEWITVGRDGKRVKHKVEITITSMEKLPKQFALAKLFCANNILNISRVKYINPYKVLLTFDNETSADELLTCEKINQLGWRCVRPYEVGISYGIIKDVELDINEKDIIEMISSTCELVAAKRLKRRNSDGTGWVESEAVRLGFKGPTLPEYVSIYGMKIKVNPYVFPVTQCSRCFRYGHVIRTCPSKKEVCPKCTKNHSNCEVTEFKCINCNGQHRALDRICPSYIKEKRIRDIMAENNCSYRKAMIMYSAKVQYAENTSSGLDLDRNAIPTSTPETSNAQIDNNRSYASILKTAGTTRCNKESAPSNQKDLLDKTAGNKTKKKKKIRGKEETSNYWDTSSNESETLEHPHQNDSRTERNRSERSKSRQTSISFKQLINKLKSICFSDEYDDTMSKIKHGISIVMEWITTFAVQYLWDLPFKINFS